MDAEDHTTGQHAVLTPCDLFLWGWAKDQVYRHEHVTIDKLEDAIHDFILNVPVELLRKAVTEEVPRLLKKMAVAMWKCNNKSSRRQLFNINRHSM